MRAVLSCHWGFSPFRTEALQAHVLHQVPFLSDLSAAEEVDALCGRMERGRQACCAKESST